MELLLLDLVSKYPVVASVIAVVGILRLVIKPLMSIVHSVADSTESAKDNEVLEKIESSKVWQGLVWLIDYLSSVKLPK